MLSFWCWPLQWIDILIINWFEWCDFMLARLAVLRVSYVGTYNLFNWDRHQSHRWRSWLCQKNSFKYTTWEWRKSFCFKILANFVLDSYFLSTISMHFICEHCCDSPYYCKFWRNLLLCARYYYEYENAFSALPIMFEALQSPQL